MNLIILSVYSPSILGVILENMIDKIINLVNLEKAYLEVVDRFLADRKNLNYHGLDGFFLRDYDLDSRQLLLACQRELLIGQVVDPALLIKIPKKNKPDNFRNIFIYNIKERIKAQAIYRIILPDLESRFSDRLFSYRPGRPPHLAAKQFCRNYRRVFLKSQAVVIDLKNYSEQINQSILIGQLERVFDDHKVIDLLKLFIGNQICHQGVINKLDRGLVQGVPLIALFANLYLSDLDFKYQHKINFYVRVGDDIALLDDRVDHLIKIKDEFFNDLLALDLSPNDHKIYCGPATGSYSFLGYQFNNGQISLESGFIDKIIANWKQILSEQHLGQKQKYNLIKRKMDQLVTNYNYQFDKLLADKPQINDYQQIRWLTDKFFIIMTKFFYQTYSPRYRRLVTKQLKRLGIKSPYQIYWQFHHGKSRTTS